MTKTTKAERLWAAELAKNYLAEKLARDWLDSEPRIGTPDTALAALVEIEAVIPPTNQPTARDAFLEYCKSRGVTVALPTL